MPDTPDFEYLACTPTPIESGEFNSNCQIPYGCTIDHIRPAMQDFISFLGYLNHELHARDLARLETLLMPASFSSIVSEFMHGAITKYCPTLIKNRYHNGHPDLIPINTYPGDAALHGHEGIEIKASRHADGWQGHNAEAIWLLIFVYDSNTQRDFLTEKPPKSFQFRAVAGAMLSEADWGVSGRSATSRRTATASVLKSGYEKIMQNWIYRAG